MYMCVAPEIRSFRPLRYIRLGVYYYNVDGGEGASAVPYNAHRIPL